MSEAASEVAVEEESSSVEGGSDGSNEVPPPDAEVSSESPPAEEAKKVDLKEDEVKNRFKLVEAAKREQVKTVQLKKEAESLLQKASHIDRQLSARSSQLDAREAKVAKLEKAIADKDIDALKEIGFDYVDLTKDHLRRGTPEYIAEQAMKKADALQKELTEERAQRDSQSKFQAHVQETRQVQENLVRFVDENEKDFPELAEWPADRIAEEGIALRDAFYREHRRMPVYDQVLEHLSAKAKREVAARTARLQKRQGLAPSDSKQGTPGQQAIRPNGAPTLSGKDAATRATPPRELTEAELDEQCLAMLRPVFGGAGKP